ncbi:MAG: YbjQ family protein [Actinobacteria bacterium]|nr:YbjQ family protein [Actinomycetota bacterium]
MFVLVGIAYLLTPPSPERPGRAALRGWAAIPNPGFWLIPVATAIAGAPGAVIAVLIDRVALAAFAIWVWVLRRHAPIQQQVRTSWIDQSPLIALVVGLLLGVISDAPEWTASVLQWLAPVVAAIGAAVFVGSVLHPSQRIEWRPGVRVGASQPGSHRHDGALGIPGPDRTHLGRTSARRLQHPGILPLEPVGALRLYRLGRCRFCPPGVGLRAYRPGGRGFHHHPLRPRRECVRRFAKGFTGAWKSLKAGEVPQFTDVLDQARREALERLIQHAQSLGANAVIGVRFDSSDVGGEQGGLSEILAYGSAVVIRPA